MPETLTGRAGRRPTVDARAARRASSASRATDLDDMVEAGLLAVAEEQDLASGQRRTVIATDDAWLLERYAELRAAGLTPERGFHLARLAVL